MFLEIFIPILIFIFGVIFASFGNVLIYRYSSHISINGEKHSFCPKCHHQLAPKDLVPVFSYIFLGGKCRYCKEKISPRYIIVELMGGVLFVSSYFLYMYLYPNNQIMLEVNLLTISNAVAFAFGSLLIVIMAYIDHKTYEIPLPLSFGFLGISVVNFVLRCIYFKSLNWEYFLGGIIPLILFLGAYLIFALGFKKEIMGLGDIILFVGIGFLIGIYEFLYFLIVTCVVASVVELIKIKKTGERKEIPFVPYIAIGFICSMYLGEYVINCFEKLL